MSGIRVNISDQVAQSESRDIDPVPTGKYLVTIEDVEIKESKSEKNPGKPYAAITFVVAEGEYEGRKIWTNIMLFGEAYSAVWLGKAMGWYTGGGELEFPEPGDLMGEQLVIKALKLGETKDKNDPSKVYPPKNEVKGFWNKSTWKGSATGGTSVPTQRSGASLLP